MDLIFDSSALTVLDTLGYKCYCCKEENPYSEDDSVIHYEMIPFKQQNEAIDYYYDCRLTGQKCYLFVDEESIKDLSMGINGLVMCIKSVELVLS